MERRCRGGRMEEEGRMRRMVTVIGEETEMEKDGVIA
jgi:hypothetical protein